MKTQKHDRWSQAAIRAKLDLMKAIEEPMLECYYVKGLGTPEEKRCVVGHLLTTEELTEILSADLNGRPIGTVNNRLGWGLEYETIRQLTSLQTSNDKVVFEEPLAGGIIITSAAKDAP